MGLSRNKCHQVLINLLSFIIRPISLIYKTNKIEVYVCYINTLQLFHKYINDIVAIVDTYIKKKLSLYLLRVITKADQFDGTFTGR